MTPRRKKLISADGPFRNGTHNYGMELEMVLTLILGDKADHTAGGNLIPSRTRAYLLQVAKKLRGRVDNIVTMDQRLRGMLFRRLHELESEVKRIRKDVDWMEMAIILLDIACRLLGYDGTDGRVYREVVFFRTRDQELADYRKQMGSKYLEEYEHLLRERYTVILGLKKKGFTDSQIAQIVGATEYAVKQVLSNELLRQAMQLRNQGLRPDQIEQRLRRRLGDILNAEDVLQVLSRKSRRVLLREI